MRLLIRLLRRAMVLGLGILSVWLIVFVFRFTDSRLPTVLALAVTYGIAAYVVLPRIVRMPALFRLPPRTMNPETMRSAKSDGPCLVRTSQNP